MSIEVEIRIEVRDRNKNISNKWKIFETILQLKNTKPSSSGKAI